MFLVISYLWYVYFFFFFSSRRRHTRFDCDWSSDVCSSDLVPLPLDVLQVLARRALGRVVLAHVAEAARVLGQPLAGGRLPSPLDAEVLGLEELGAGEQGDAGRSEDFHRRAGGRGEGVAPPSFGGGPAAGGPVSRRRGAVASGNGAGAGAAL